VSFLRGSRGVAAFFKDAQKANAVVVLDGAEILLSNVASQYCSVTSINENHLGGFYAHAVDCHSVTIILLATLTQCI
jgi:hypothetical protein